MDFNQGKPIYVQISDWVCEKILRQEWLPDERIPSVRETAMTLQVNPNTSMRAYEGLQGEGIIYNKRGIGYFVHADASAKILERERTQFLSDSLPHVFARMELLGLDIQALNEEYEIYKNNKS